MDKVEVPFRLPLVMRHWQRNILTVWFGICFLIALNATAQMFITFAPQNRDDPALARAETRAIERVRRVWSVGVFACSGALVISAGLALKLAQTRRGGRRGAGDGSHFR